MSHLSNEPVVKIVMQMTCPKCGKNMQKEMMLPRSMARVMAGITNVFCDPCGDAVRVEQEKRTKELADIKRMDAAKIPQEFRKWDESRGNQQAATWVNENRNNNLLMIGEVNTGKTRAMAKILIEECIAGKKVLFLDFCEFAEKYAGTMQESINAASRYMNKVICGNDIVLFDDIDKRRINETAGNLLYKLFNKLYSGEVPARLWFTMNHNGIEFLRMFENKDYGAAVISRIDRMMKDGRFVVKKI